jgi:hypothetical protein
MTGNLTLDELYTQANEMCRKHWGVDYTGTIELVNNKWRSMMACFSYNRKDESKQIIRMSIKTNAKLMRVEVLNNLLHELVHWRLYTQGLPFGDCDRVFIAECCRVGASLSGTKAVEDAYKRYLQYEKYSEVSD